MIQEDKELKMIRKELGELCHYIETDYGTEYIYAPFVIEDIEEFTQLEKENELPEWRACLSDIFSPRSASCTSSSRFNNLNLLATDGCDNPIRFAN